MREKTSPIRKVGKNPNNDLNVEGQSYRQLALIQDSLVHVTDFHRPRRLYNKGSECKKHPAPSRVLIYNLQGVILGNVPTINYRPTFILLINYGAQTTKYYLEKQDKQINPHSRSSTKSTLLSVRADCRESIRDDSNEQVDKPEVEDDNTYNEEEARDEKLGIDH